MTKLSNMSFRIRGGHKDGTTVTATLMMAVMKGKSYNKSRTAIQYSTVLAAFCGGSCGAGGLLLFNKEHDQLPVATVLLLGFVRSGAIG